MNVEFICQTSNADDFDVYEGSPPHALVLKHRLEREDVSGGHQDPSHTLLDLKLERLACSVAGFVQLEMVFGAVTQGALLAF